MVIAQSTARLTKAVACHTGGLSANDIHVLEHLLGHDFDKSNSSLNFSVGEVCIGRHRDHWHPKAIAHLYKGPSEG